MLQKLSIANKYNQNIQLFISISSSLFSTKPLQSNPLPYPTKEYCYHLQFTQNNGHDTSGPVEIDFGSRCVMDRTLKNSKAPLWAYVTN